MDIFKHSNDCANDCAKPSSVHLSTVQPSIQLPPHACHACPYLPVELILHIFSFVDDIDIRRQFRIYGKIDLKKYEFLNYITLIPGEHHFNPNITRYQYLKNLDHYKRLCENDMIDIDFKICKRFVKYEIGIYRIRKKSGEKIKEKYPKYYLEDDNYFWDFVKSSYTRF